MAEATERFFVTATELVRLIGMTPRPPAAAGSSATLVAAPVGSLTIAPGPVAREVVPLDAALPQPLSAKNA
ncbi:MAG: hypothetical protein IPL41_13685 [Micropruina sp.]|nr:hypothetical protein [Micropruina sp.]